jgi:hypothetical protein
METSANHIKYQLWNVVAMVLPVTTDLYMICVQV